MSDFALDNFINREKEVGLVVNRVFDLAKRKPFAPKERVFHFVGPSGIGKSCLLEKCKHKLTIERAEYASLLIPLDSLKKREKGFINELLVAVHNEFCDCKDMVLKKDDSQNRQKFVSHVQRKINGKNQITILFLDEINIPSQEDLRELEDYLLVKFLHDNDRAILVTAGRSKPPVFNDFAIRPTPFNTFLLPLFDEEKTRIHMESLKPGAGELAEKIWKMGNGVPGNTVKLVKHVSGDPPNIPNETKAVESLLDDIKKENEIQERYYPMLEAISILRGFFQEDVVPLFQSHPNLSFGWDEGRVKEVFLELNRIQVGPGGLVDWDREKKHWAMDESIRDLFEKELQMRDPELWTKLHCTALGMYQEWGQKYNSDLYWNKSNHHKQRLQSAGLNCNDLEG
ncbi:MAG: hypothetical protein HYZ22_04160 [Chloroflexi bacterium]|nr:hypothetical protein [Chloroflexota bacterium]